MMIRFMRACGAVAAIALLTACALNGVATVPPLTQGNLGSNTLEFAVGTANIGQDGNAPGLNVVATLRQPNGLTAVLADTPTLTGPGGFAVPAGMPGAYGAGNVDAGTAHVSASAQVGPTTTPRNTTFGTFNGLFAYGIGPFNSDNQTPVVGAYFPGSPNASLGNGFTLSAYDGSSVVASFAPANPFTGSPSFTGDPTQPLPFYGAKTMDYLGGPPAYPFFSDGVTQPPAFAGYVQGFTNLELTPVAGTYSLSVAVTPTNAKGVTYTKSATLTNTTLLGAIPAPTFTEDGNGGGNGTISVTDGRVTETMVYVVDASAGHYYTVGPLTGHGVLAFALPDGLGPCVGVGCQNTSSATPSIGSGDNYLITAVGYDYPAFEAGPPNNHSTTPVITGAGGQADLTSSIIVGGTYGSGGGVSPVSKVRRPALIHPHR